MFIKKKLLLLPMDEKPILEEGKTVLMTSSQHMVDGKSILACTFWVVYPYSPGETMFRVFCSRENYITYVYHEKRWSHAGAFNLLPWDCFCRGNKKIQSKKEEDELVGGFFGVSEKGITALKNFQKNKMANSLESKLKKRYEETDKLMAQVMPLPRGIETWIDTVVFATSAYLYYKRDKKTIKGYCTLCRHDVVIKKGGHNEMAICPHCRKKVQLKATGKATRICDDGTFFYLQKVEEGLLAREFKAHKNFGRQYKKPELHYYESARYLILEDREVQYLPEWETTLQKKVWKRKERVEWTDPRHLYPKNVKGLLKDGAYQYSGLYELAQSRTPFNIGDFFRAYRKHPVLEHIIKQGYTRFACDVIGESYRNTMILKDGTSKMTQVFDLPKEYFMGFCRKDISAELLYTLKKLKESSLKLLPITKEIAEGLLCSAGRNGDAFLKCEEFSSLRRTLAYLGQQKHSVWFYYDYLEMGAKLAYELGRKRVLYPEDLKAAHDKAVHNLKEKTSKEQNEQIEKQGLALDEKYAFAFGGLMIFSVKKAEELYRESAALGHCVKGYVDRVAKGETAIFFIRKKENEAAPYYTLELKNDKVMQCRTKGNESYERSKSVLGFVKRWLKEKVEKEREERVQVAG